MAKCKHATCEADAVTYLLTQGAHSRARGGRPEKRDDECRSHYVEGRRADGKIVACELLKDGVIVRDVSGEDRENRGARIEFDTDETDVDLLVQVRLVRLLDGPSLVDAIKAEQEALAARLKLSQDRLAAAEKQAKAEAAAQAKADKAKG
jgi:predicted RNA-binding protein